MGQTQTATAVNPVDPENPVFVIPRNIYFTPLQVAQMIDAGQQPGVPFHVNDTGVQRPTRPMRKAQIAECHIALAKNSVRIETIGGEKFKMSFIYDAGLPCTLTIHFGAGDAHSSKEIRLNNTVARWGPFELSAGLNMTWTSAEAQLVGDCKHLPNLYKKMPAFFDVIFVLECVAPVAQSFNSRSSTPTQVKSPIGFAMTNNSSKVSTPTRYSNKSAVKHISYFKIVKQKSKSTRGDTGFMVPLQCVYQKIFLDNSGVYVVQDIYGMDRKGPTSTTATNSITTTSMSNYGGETKEPPSMLPSTPMSCGTPQTVDSANEDLSDSNGVELTVNLVGEDAMMDLDSEECVICLTDPREVAVYPCRHMCMCITCADALPAGNNKCPLCRREAILLIKINAAAPKCIPITSYPQKDAESTSP